MTMRHSQLAQIDHIGSVGGPKEAADVVVVGARCAGASTAMLLAEQGHDVLVVDRAMFPSDTLSTHAIARTGVVQLNRWGLLDRVLASGAPPIREVMFHAADERIVRSIKDRSGVDLLVAPRRHELDTIMLEAAARSGVRVRTGVTIDGLCRADDGRVTGVYGRDGSEHVEISSRFVVGADGLKSRIARSVDAPLIEARPSTGATHYAYFRGHWSAMEYYLGDRTFAGIFPTHAGEACVWVCNEANQAEEYRRTHRFLDDAFDTMIRDTAPELAARVEASTRMSVARGMLRLPNQRRHPVGDGWALVGDAGYHRDAITGHGISDAFRDADLLATALDAALRGEVDEVTALNGYHAERDAMSQEIFDITCELSQFPPAARFSELQKALGRAIEAQSAELAARPRHTACAPV